MNFKENNIYSGFKLLNIENLNEIGGVGLRFEHEKTKAKLIKILSEDDNKCFAIGFRTPPENSTGVPHILEHSVLCGSRKFNTKEPFVELLKGSLNTFLNAMTYPDKTIYPVASRNEKDLDPNLAEIAANRAAQLVEMLGAGKVLKGVVDVYPNKPEPKKLVVNPQRINHLLGVDVPMEQFVGILESLEFKCNLVANDKLEIDVPSFRTDMEQEADVWEEIARIYGFENIPSVQLEGNTTAGIKTSKQKFMDALKDNSTAVGLNEILTYSFVSPKGVDKIRVPEGNAKRNFVKLLNPLGEETSVMRTTLIPNMLDVLSTNVSHKIEEVSAFECGHIFIPQDSELPKEENRMCVGMYGKDVDFFALKGTIETILVNVGFKGYEIEPQDNNTTFHPGRCAKIVYNNKYVGTLGELHPDVIENYNLGQRVYVAEIDIDFVFDNSDRTKNYVPLPKYPSTSRDIALIVKDDVFVKQIEDIIKENGQGLVESYKLFDVYKGSQIEAGYKSIAYSITYRSKDKTLTDEDVAKVHDKILSELSEKLNANLRSN
ncbi:MAG: hypothetical protein E7I73_08280 [Clostridium perfringens]|nr:hypothetical protein [Clostridium perfringens]